MQRRAWLVLCFSLLLAVAYVSAQQESLSERFKRMSVAAEKEGLKDPYRGIQTSSGVEKGLYSIKSTGVSTEPVRKAADAFLASLTPDQRNRTTYTVDDDEWRKWMNQHFYVRQGVSFLEMSEKQRDAAFALMKSSLSARGLQLSKDIMKLNQTLGELNNNDFEQYGEWRYYLTVMGRPSKTEPWGWQVDGHHLIVNYFVLGDQVVATPMFVGSEPVVARSGKYKGLEILQDEQRLGLKMLLSLDQQQRAKAVLEVSKTGNNNLTEAFKDNVTLDYAGVRVGDLPAAQKQQMLELIQQYVDNMDDGHAKVKMDEVRRHLDRTYFAWIGGGTENSVYYYRIHSPVIVIEFDHQKPAGMRHLMDPNQPFRDHIHCVVRTPNGNDYGKDLLRQHYLEHPHT